MSLDGENKTLSRLMSAVGKTKIYKDTSKVVKDMVVDCAVRTTTTASKHYTMMKQKYSDEEIADQEECTQSVINTARLDGDQSSCVNDTAVLNEQVDGIIVPKYRIVKKTDLAISNEMSSQSIVCYIEMAGVKSSTIELTFYYSEMIISAKKQYPIGLGDMMADNIVAESIVGNTQYGGIRCKIQLPVNVNEPHKVETNYIDGVLIVSIPTNSYIEPVVVKYKKSRSKNI